MINPFTNSRYFLRNKKYSFTLIELLMALGIAGILFTTLYGVYIFGMKISHKGFTETQLQMETRIFLQNLCDDLGYAYKLEEFSNNRIKFKRFFKNPNTNENSFGESSLQDITYEITRENGKSVIKRYIDIKGTTLLTADSINEDIFIGYKQKDIVKKIGAKNVKSRFFEIYDTFIGDSEGRKKITLIRINLNIKKNNEEIQVITKVSLPYIYKKLLEPYWNGG